ncbi:hypothetical protein SUGI_1141270 [Cryptomeria japonica]|uniref:tetratricopeptide repeat protein SKI3 isoform X2 n=1 Tax=Cryptomeria japonica TaxID=3369 RepID=UPI00241492C1|nr:tetratricopeptide repeat protein SKI3 isoform X2 [Cryptomeria japonica]GLJ53491.1 hypothetical protein SUGI_1141270 [Cryptomeria japonica]
MEAPKKSSSVLKSAVEELSKGRHEEAVTLCKQLLKQPGGQNNYDALVVLGKALFASGQYDHAETSYRRAAALSPNSLRAWQGLVELSETSEKLDKMVEACESIIEIAKSTDDNSRLTDYLCRLGRAYAKSNDYEKASQTWSTLLGIVSVSETQRFEALCGLADAQAVIMGKSSPEPNINLSQKEQPACSLSEIDTSRPVPLLGSIAPEDNSFSVKDKHHFYGTVEALLKEIINISPQSHRYQDMFLKLLLDRMREAQSSGGQRYKKAQLQVMQHSMAMLSYFFSETALGLAFTMCVEDDTDQIFGAMGMEKSVAWEGRILWLGKRFAHIYPQHGRSLVAIAYAMHCRSGYSLERIKSICEQVLQLDLSCIIGWHVLAEIWSFQKSFSNVQQCVTKGQEAIFYFREAYGFSLKVAELRLQLVLANAHLSLGSYDESNAYFNIIVEVAEKLGDAEALKVKYAAIEGQIKIFLAKGCFEEAWSKLENLLAMDANNHWARAESGWLAFQRGNLDDALCLLAEAVNMNSGIAIYHHRLGFLYWKASENLDIYKEKAVEQFILAVKLNPSDGDAFRFLGHYYSQVTKEMNRAIRCYQKCVTLNPEDSEAGEVLCDILNSAERETLEASICHEASQSSPRAFWAWRRMGYIKVNQRKWSDAVGSLQHAIRGYPICADLWEALGLAYQRHGMLTAAVKAYARAIALEGNSRVFSLIESGNIFSSLRSYKKAVEHFRLAVESAPQNLAAQYGLASGLLGMSKECTALGAFGWAADLTKEASEIAFATSLLFGNITAVWKLLGDIEVAYAQSLPWEVEGGDFKKESEAFKDSVCSWKQQRLQAAISAKHAYECALHLNPLQANLYKDIAISVELIHRFDQKEMPDQNVWCLQEVMALGGLILEGDNAESWITMGCFSKQKAIQQHAFIRALQVDGSHALAWAQLGKLYLVEGQKELARQAFDGARCADPLLALSWAGMSVHEYNEGVKVVLEAFASCLYAVQLMPVAEFQLGLTKLAVSTGHLQSSKVLAAIEQAVQRAPHLPESHNLSGLVWESRQNFQRATVSYKRARYALEKFGRAPQSCYYDISLNLVRALCQAGQAKDAVNECEALEKAGMLDSEGLQIYAVALWQLGNNDLALSAVRKAVAISQEKIKTATVVLYCKLIYRILGQGFAMDEILKIPKEFLQDTNFSYIAIAIAILDTNVKISHFLYHSDYLLFQHKRAPVLHSLLAVGKQLSESDTKMLAGEVHLKKALHMYPQSNLIRSQLGFLLLSSRECNSSHIAAKCAFTGLDRVPNGKESTSTLAVLGAAAIACSDCGVSNPMFSFSTCRNRGAIGFQVILQLQRWFHLEPWNYTARYLLILNMYQKARGEKYPHHLCQVIKRLVSSHSNLVTNKGLDICHFQELQLLLCTSEIYLQSGDYSGALKYATTASHLQVSNSLLFFSHLQLARCHALQNNLISLNDEYMNCLQLKTDSEIGWVTLSALKARYSLQGENNCATIHHGVSMGEEGCLQNMWMALLELVHGQRCIWDGDLQSAEKAIAQACSMWPEEGSLHLIHGAICMQLARQGFSSQFLLIAAHSLLKAQDIGHFSLPVVSILLAQAEASIGRGKARWERNLRLEWLAWPAEIRPAELLFQMHLLAEQSRAMSERDKNWPETSKSSRLWLQHALHLNPSCLRYWETMKQALKLN